MRFPPKKFAWLVVGVIVAALGWLLTSKRSINLRDFNPAAIAQHEAAAWKAYYAGEWFQLFSEVYQVGANEYGLALGDSLRLGYHAARSAWIFRTGKLPERTAAAEIEIRPFYQIISERSGLKFDNTRVAKLEVAWWEMRRQLRPGEAWAQTIAEQSGLVFDRPAESFLPATRLRVEAMQYRDQRRDGKMTDSDWEYVRALLTESAQLFWNAVHATPEPKN